MKLTLASGSKDRRKLLENLGMKFDVFKNRCRRNFFF